MNKLWDLRYYLIITLVILGTVSYKYLDYQTTKLVYENPQVLTITKFKKVGELQVFGAERFKLNVDGSVEAFGGKLSLVDKYNLTSQEYSKTTPVLPVQLFTIYAYYPISANITTTPDIVGVSYIILKPLSINLLYCLPTRTGYIGMGFGL